MCHRGSQHSQWQPQVCGTPDQATSRVTVLSGALEQTDTSATCYSTLTTNSALVCNFVSCILSCLFNGFAYVLILICWETAYESVCLLKLTSFILRTFPFFTSAPLHLHLQWQNFPVICIIGIISAPWEVHVKTTLRGRTWREKTAAQPFFYQERMEATVSCVWT